MSGFAEGFRLVCLVQGLIYTLDKANAVADAINAVEPGRALAVVGDILDGEYIETLVKQTAEFGGGKIHIIVNNAGFTWDGVIHKVSLPAKRDTVPMRSHYRSLSVPRMTDSDYATICISHRG
jgi:NAD(P)-dependent dehydrogenase (short-subunit alcohol dehydrogenase family)